VRSAEVAELAPNAADLFTVIHETAAFLQHLPQTLWKRPRNTGMTATV